MSRLTFPALERGMYMTSDVRGNSETAFRLVIVAGTAQLPTSISGPNGSGVLELDVLVDLKTMQVKAVKSNCLSTLSEVLLTELLGSRVLETDMEDVEQALNSRFFSPKREAVIAALQDVQKQCRELRISQP